MKAAVLVAIFRPLAFSAERSRQRVAHREQALHPGHCMLFLRDGQQFHLDGTQFEPPTEPEFNLFPCEKKRQLCDEVALAPFTQWRERKLGRQLVQLRQKFTSQR